MSRDRGTLRDVWLMFTREHNCSLDRMLCSTTLREAFLLAARQTIGDHSDDEILWSLMSMRKSKRLGAK